MQLTRRDALTALGALGLSAAAWVSDDDVTESAFTERDIEDLRAIAETLYPTAVSVDTEFIETYVVGQHHIDENHDQKILAAVETVRERSRVQTGAPLQELPPAKRESVLRATGGDRAYPDPDGTDAERVRYYILNNLLYALYTTPSGGELIGNPNPPGYPGGTDSYQEVATDE